MQALLQEDTSFPKTKNKSHVECSLTLLSATRAGELLRNMVREAELVRKDWRAA